MKQCKFYSAKSNPIKDVMGWDGLTSSKPASEPTEHRLAEEADPTPGLRLRQDSHTLPLLSA